MIICPIFYRQSSFSITSLTYMKHTAVGIKFRQIDAILKHCLFWLIRSFFMRLLPQYLNLILHCLRILTATDYCRAG